MKLTSKVSRTRKRASALGVMNNKSLTSTTTAKELYARFHQLKVESAELPGIVKDKRDKVTSLLKLTCPWSHWYEIPYTHSLGIMLVLFGFQDAIIEASKSDDPLALFRVFDDNPDPIDDDELSDEEKSFLIGLFMNVLHQMESLSIFSESLSSMVEKASKNDEKLFDAVLVDRSITACPAIAKRIEIAQLEQDESFMHKLSM